MLSMRKHESRQKTPEVERFGSQALGSHWPNTNKSMVSQMRAIFIVGSLSLILTDGTARAQSGPSQKSATSTTTAQIPRTPNDPANVDRLTPSDKERIAQYMTQCLNDWDAATHMTKPEWARVCRRVIDGRVKFRLETGFRVPELR